MIGKFAVAIGSNAAERHELQALARAQNRLGGGASGARLRLLRLEIKASRGEVGWTSTLWANDDGALP